MYYLNIYCNSKFFFTLYINLFIYVKRTTQFILQRIYNNISNSKCISIQNYINNENIKINIINKSLNINPKITKFTFNDTYDIIIEDVDEEEEEEEEELSYLGLLATSLTSTIKSKKIKDEIVSKFQKITKIT